MSLPLDVSVSRTVEVLASVDRQMTGAMDRLVDAHARARGLSADTDWRTDAATRFHALAQAWERDVGMLAGEVFGARESVRRVRWRLEALAWGPMV